MECPDCLSEMIESCEIIQGYDYYSWECPECGRVITQEPDWDNLKGGKDYE